MRISGKLAGALGIAFCMGMAAPRKPYRATSFKMAFVSQDAHGRYLGREPPVDRRLRHRHAQRGRSGDRQNRRDARSSWLRAHGTGLGRHPALGRGRGGQDRLRAESEDKNHREGAAPRYGQPEGIAWDGTALWTVDARAGKLNRLDDSDGTTFKSIASPTANGREGRGDRIGLRRELPFCRRSRHGHHLRMDPKTGAVMDMFPSPGPSRRDSPGTGRTSGTWITRRARCTSWT